MILNNIMPHLTNYLSDPTIERIVDFGCGVGHLTHQLAKRIIPLDGEAYGVDFSEKEIKLARHHKELRDVQNLHFYVADLYNLKENKEANKKLKHLDGAVGIGLLQYLPDLNGFLKEVRRRLRKKGKIYFIDYDYPGKLFEKPWIEHDDWIKEIFEKEGFKVHIWRQRTLFWQYVHIYGYKK